MFQNICAIPLDHDLFTQAIHPQVPVLSVGLSSGHVHSYRLPADASPDDDGDGTLGSQSGFGHIETAWKTRRHKGSCRALSFAVDGTQLYSAGTDGIVKAADALTGNVVAKIAVPLDPYAVEPQLPIPLTRPSLIHALSPQTLLLATDSSALHLYDLRDLGPKASPKPQQTHHPHDDYISSLTPLPPSAASTSGFSKQWVSTGGTTLAVTDLRRGVMVRSEDQEEELLCSVMVSGLSKKGSSVGEKVVVGGGNGVLTLWERGVWDDQDERITVDKTPGGGESLDTMALLPPGVGPGGKVVAVGLGNGALRFVKIGANQIIAELSHDELEKEAVVGLGFDVTGRMISGGGKMVKVWGEPGAYGGDEDDDDDEEEEEEDQVADDGVADAKRARESDEDSDEEMDDSSEDEKPTQKRKKRKKGKTQQQQNHGIMGFSGLE
ncbi:WD repeat-containing protein jip5 [Kalmusia sp. IMI 367209]|nr:WD repeat-containing protein jip5 [Kalmusia sp. IMI 367209]